CQPTFHIMYLTGHGMSPRIGVARVASSIGGETPEETGGGGLGLRRAPHILRPVSPSYAGRRPFVLTHPARHVDRRARALFPRGALCGSRSIALNLMELVCRCCTGTLSPEGACSGFAKPRRPAHSGRS